MNCDSDFYEMHIEPYVIYGNFPFYYFVDHDHKPIVNYNLQSACNNVFFSTIMKRLIDNDNHDDCIDDF